jgi:hypothetical protein
VSRRLAYTSLFVASILVLLAVGWFFRLSVGGAGREEAAAVVLAPPPDAVVEVAGELGPDGAARAFAIHAGRHPGVPRVALSCERAGTRVVLVLDRESGTIEERRGGPTGTRVATVWKGGLEARLAEARERGTFDVPGLAPPEEKNLYH